jgi:hypothetical protein
LKVPRNSAAKVGLTEGATDRRLIVSRSRRRFMLEELLAGMTPEREHPLEDDSPRGAEII